MASALSETISAAGLVSPFPAASTANNQQPTTQSPSVPSAPSKHLLSNSNSNSNSCAAFSKFDAGTCGCYRREKCEYHSNQPIPEVPEFEQTKKKAKQEVSQPPQKPAAAIRRNRKKPQQQPRDSPRLTNYFTVAYSWDKFK